MASFESDIKRLLLILQQENQNTTNQQNIKYPEPKLTPENFIKQQVIINLIVGYDFPHGIFDPAANNSQGGYINKIVNIIAGGPNQIIAGGGGVEDI